MDGYYSAQVSMPYFKGTARQRGSGLGSFALKMGRTALPLVQKYVLPAAKRIGKEIIQEGTPEVMDVISGKKKPKQAFKGAVKRAVKRQFGGGSVRKRRSRKKRTTSRKKRATTSKKKKAFGKKRRVFGKRKRVIIKRKRSRRSRFDILGKLN